MTPTPLRGPPRVIRDMPPERYHAVPALSAGGAWLLANECPAIYWHGSPFNPDAAPPENGEPMDIGTALHLAMLEPDRLAERVSLIDADDWRTKAAKEARDSAYEVGLVPLLPKDVALVGRLARELRSNEYVADLLDGAAPEVSYFWNARGVPCKARADLITRDGAVMADFKTSASASPPFFQRQAFNAGHFLRAPWYMDGWREAGNLRVKEYWFVVVARKAPHLVTICRLDERAIEWGRMMIGRSLDLFRRCRDAGEWPGYCPEPTTLGLPGWSEYQLADKEQAGFFREHATAADARRSIAWMEP